MRGAAAGWRLAVAAGLDTPPPPSEGVPGALRKDQDEAQHPVGGGVDGPRAVEGRSQDIG